MQHEPHGSCGSPVDPLVCGSVEDPGAPARRIMVRPGVEGSSAGGDERGRKLLRRPADDVLRRGFGGLGTTAVGPGRAGSSVLESAELSISCSSELEIAEHRGREDAAGAATHHGLPVRKDLSNENPMSGSGPSESARPEGDQPVEAARNREDGRRRAGRPGATIPPPTSLKGRETPGGAIRSGMTGEGASARTLRGRRSLREQAGRSSDRTVRSDGGTPRGRTNDVEEAANQSRRYAGRRAPRGRFTLRGSSGGSRGPLEQPRRSRNPWRGLDGLVLA